MSEAKTPDSVIASAEAPVEEGETRRDPLPEKLPLLPLGDMVLFPGMVLALIIHSERSKKLVDDVVADRRLFLAVLQRDGEKADDQVKAGDLYGFGCLTRLIKMMKFPDDTVRILVQGVKRCRLKRIEEEGSYLEGKFKTLEDVLKPSIELEALAENAAQRFREIVALSPNLPDELQVVAMNLRDPAKLADLIAANLNIDIKERQGYLENLDVKHRLTELTGRLTRDRDVLQLGSEIQDKVSEKVSKNQREFFLREQVKAIQKELGEESPQQADAREIEQRIQKAKMPKEAREAALKEKERLLSLSPASPEYGMVRTYLDWLLDLPWAVQTSDLLDINASHKVLDRDHYGLKRVKDRILEYLAVLKLKHDMKGPILCFAGPPGVGKTSLGQSIARALGRHFVRMSLGGIHDEAEIRGHRRTYIGALPGRIIQGLRKAGTRNPVFMLDEIDKVGSDFRGDPSSALLEVLDPEQNDSFADHYLDVAFDLSTVLFITTANRLDTIPPALRDRMEVLELPGYTASEKVKIAARHLVGKQIKAHGLKRRNVTFPREVLEEIVTGYTREAGVRQLEREIATVCRKIARATAEKGPHAVTLSRQKLKPYLGPLRFEPEAAERRLEPGVATGLAWTPVGGEILYVEATHMPGKGQLILTGSMGEVMKESARAALSYVRAHAQRWGFADVDFEKTDLHVHVPAGAIPKDGPSAGMAMLLALVSLFRNQPLPSDMAMTGEITLRGAVMPVGGVKEKLLAAARAGIREVLLPRRNRNDLDEIPAEVRRKLRFTFVSKMDLAVNHWIKSAASNPPAKRRRK